MADVEGQLDPAPYTCRHNDHWPKRYGCTTSTYYLFNPRDGYTKREDAYPLDPTTSNIEELRWAEYEAAQEYAACAGFDGTLEVYDAARAATGAAIRDLTMQLAEARGGTGGNLMTRSEEVYTPTTGAVRASYVAVVGTSVREALAEFDRWIADHEAEVRHIGFHGGWEAHAAFALTVEAEHRPKLDPEPYYVDESGTRYSVAEIRASQNDGSEYGGVIYNLANFAPRPGYSQRQEDYR